ncbi:MAG: DUF3293 domain-containing protein [Thermoanaerobaculia bacterium]|nr:DUF3293 domain-containing protein [Thermoanaerobaculia bacterium]
MTGLAEVINKVLERDSAAVTEASLSRLFAHAQDGSFAIVSGWRSSQPQAESEKADAALRQEIRSLGLGYIELEGHWEEADPEPLYCVFGLTKDHTLRIRATYDQDAVIYREGSPDDQVLLLRAGGQTDCLGGPAPLALTQAIAAWKGSHYVVEALPSTWAGAVGFSKRLGRIRRRRSPAPSEKRP